MSARLAQTLYSSLASLVFLVAVYRLGRKERLSFRYAVGWMSLGALGVIAGALVPLAAPLAKHLHVTPGALLAIAAVILLLVLCVQLSISISGLQEQVRTLAEESSFLREELDALRPKD